MSEELLAALIGVGGVIVGTIFGWILSVRWQAHRERSQRYRSDLLELREALLTLTRVLENGEPEDFRDAATELFLAIRKAQKYQDMLDSTVSTSLHWFVSGEYRPFDAEILSKLRKARRQIEESIE